MYADPLAERVWIVWGVLILRVVGLLMLAHKEPLSNTRGVASVGEKIQKKKEKKELHPRCWSKLASHGSYESNTHALLKV